MEQNQRPVESYEVQVLGLVMSHFRQAEELHNLTFYSKYKKNSSGGYAPLIAEAIENLEKEINRQIEFVNEIKTSF